jgi:fatty acid/phospholipid biosynthesis enzyme
MYFVLHKRGIQDDYLERFNYENFGGTPILGVNAPVIIGHGISNKKAFKNMMSLNKKGNTLKRNLEFSKKISSYIFFKTITHKNVHSLVNVLF